MPVGGDVEQVLYVGADIHRATRLAQGEDARGYAPVVGDAVLSGRADTEDGTVGTRIRIHPDFGAYSPVAFVLCRNGRHSQKRDDHRKKNLFHVCYFNLTKVACYTVCRNKYTKLIRCSKNFSTNRTFLSLKTKACGMHAAGFRWYGCSGGCR